MPTPNKLQLLRDMSLDATSLESAIAELNWVTAGDLCGDLKDRIKAFEAIIATEPMPSKYAEKCTCLNCIPPKPRLDFVNNRGE